MNQNENESQNPGTKNIFFPQFHPYLNDKKDGSGDD